MLTAEPEHLRLQSGGKRVADLVVGVENGEVLGRLILEDTFLRRDVILHRTVTVEMIGRDVQNCGNMRAERLNRLQLKAGNLQHHPGICRGLFNKSDRWRADVSAHQRLASAGGDDLSGERRRSGLSIRAGDGDNVAL